MVIFAKTQANMKIFRKLMTATTDLLLFAFLGSLGILIYSQHIRADKTSFPYFIVCFGCFLHTNNIHTWLLLFGLVGLLVEFKVRENLISDLDVHGKRKWKLILSSKRLDQDKSWISLLPSFNRLMILLYFVSRMSFLWDYCR